ncbi:hypothetical protein MBANPS3_007146 [Mucor bainieri]
MVRGGSQLRAFEAFLFRHMDERHALKHIALGCLDGFANDMQHLLPVAITSSLETLKGTVIDEQFFVALLEIIESGITESKLKIIPCAFTYSTAYDALLYRLKDSLEEVHLQFKWDSAERRTTLYNLDQMTRLQSLCITTKFHTISQINMILLTGTGRDSDFDTWLSRDVDKDLNLTTLKIKFGKIYDSHLIDYLMHKYPGIDTIVVERMPQDAWKTFNSPKLALDLDNLIFLLKKIKVVPRYAVQCLVSKTDAKQVLFALTLFGYKASLVRHMSVNSFTTEELQVNSSHKMIPSDIYRAVNIPPTLYMT